MLFYTDLNNYIAQQRARLDALGPAGIPERGTIARVLAPGPHQDRKADLAGYSVTRAVEEINVDTQGVLGDRHRGYSQRSTGRESSLYPRRTLTRQHRHLCVVSGHDCRVLSARLGVEITPELLGANLVVERLDGAGFSISQLPPGTHLLVIPKDADEVPKPPIATIVHYVQQQGCGVTGKAIAARYDDPTLVRRFREHSREHRGIICSVEYPVAPTARLVPGQQIAFRFPTAVAP